MCGVFFVFLDYINKHTTQAGLVLLVPIQYFLGIVCFLSKTHLTNSTVRLNARGHFSIFLL
jgi:hypothetical protein